MLPTMSPQEKALAAQPRGHARSAEPRQHARALHASDAHDRGQEDRQLLGGSSNNSCC